MKQTICMKVTKDRYELPVAVADTFAELAKILGMKPEAIYSNISHCRKNGWKCSYIKVEVD